MIERASEFAEHMLQSDMSGHDWWHVSRVAKLARKIATVEGADVFVCELAAWLHDIADDKVAGTEENGLKTVVMWLQENKLNHEDTEHVLTILRMMSFRGGSRPPVQTLEAEVVQDADRLDALGAVGIARAFAYAGAIGQPIYHPDLQPRTEMTPEEYRHGKSTAINHFYEKLLHLKDLMNTEAGKELAYERHRVVVDYLAQFLLEWNGSV